jgi:glycosyltransferase involved in cell wall biosynthesis
MTRSMRIMWTVNIPLPAACKALGLPESPFGGWLTTMTRQLGTVPGVQLGVAMRAPVQSVRSVEVDGITYYALPQVGKGGMDAHPDDCTRILAEFQPDLLHAEGSEMAYTHRMLQAWNGPRLLSLQGVVNGIAPFYLGGLQLGKALLSLRLRQTAVITMLAVNKWLRFRPRMRDERNTIAMVDHIVGRTQWDHAHAWMLNPTAKYYHCGRTLRPAFHQARWQRAGCDRHTIFVGNSAVALKGIHVLLEALVLLRKEYPQVRVVIAGEPANATKKRLSQLFGYPAYLRDRIAEFRLGPHVEFAGLLDEQGIAARMLRSHVYAMTVHH